MISFDDRISFQRSSIRGGLTRCPVIDENAALEKFLAGHRARCIYHEGFLVSHSTMAKYCSPAINIGPPSEAY
jgi:hypothetical protein